MSNFPTKKVNVGFNGGIDKDTVVSKYDMNNYFDATDMRIISKGTLSNGALTNVIGNKEKILFQYPNEVLVGSATVKNDLVLFTKYGTRTDMFYYDLVDQFVLHLYVNSTLYKFKIIDVAEEIDSQYLGYIYTSFSTSELASFFSSFSEISDYFLVVPSWKTGASSYTLSFFSKSAESDSEVLSVTTEGVISSTSYSVGSKISFIENYNSISSVINPTIIFNDQNSTSKLNFVSSEYVSALGRYESDDVKKVYWANDIDPLRYVNIANYGSISEANEFDHIPNVEFSEIDVSLVQGGNLKAGVIQYSYQFYNKYGAASTFSPTSRLIKLSKNKDTYGGSNLGDSVNKSVQISITNTNTTFNSVRIISIFYDTYNSSPVLNIVYDTTIDIDQELITYVDNGSTLGTISLEEFRIFASTTFSPKVLETKNNYLFLGNITEDTFTSDAIDNWDARAYQFDAYHGSSKIYNTPVGELDDDYYLISYTGSGTYYPKSGSSSPIYDWDIPESFNCCNRDNSIYDNGCSVPTYKCNPDLLGSSVDENIVTKSDMVFGGKGKNLSFKFYEYINPERSTSYDGIIKDVKYKTKISGSVVNSEYITECCPNEVYRIGIKFFNQKGQSSYVKWIADVRWPYINMQNTSVLEISIDTFPDDSSITHYQIVRVRRDLADSSIKNTGLVLPTNWTITTLGDPGKWLNTRVPRIGYFSTTEYGAAPSIKSYQDNPTVFDGRVCEFFSPETIYNNPKLEYNIDSKLILSSIITVTSDVVYEEGNKEDTFDVKSYFLQSDIIPITESAEFSESSTTSYYIAETINPSLSHKKSDIQNQLYSYGEQDKYYLNQFCISHPDYSISTYASRSTFPILFLNEEIDLEIYSDTTDYYNKYYIGSIIHDIDSSRYGGYSVYSKSINQYIDFSDIHNINDTNALCKNGDSYSNNFWFMRAYYYAEDTTTAGKNTSIRQYCKIYVPTRINTMYSSTDVSKIINYEKLQETTEEGILLYPLEYNSNIDDLYIYNNVYSTVSDADLSIVKPTNFTSISNIPNKVLASEKKINNEYIDPWTNYVSTNYIEVDGSYGEIVGLSKFKSNLHFFQTGATGVLSVEDRSLISDSSGEQLSLGLSGVLSRYDYLTFSGPSSPHSILQTKNNLYYIDSLEKRIYSSLTDNSSVSEELGISSLLNETITSSSIIRCGYDYEFKEALFSIDNITICLNENTGKFTSKYAFTPDIFITTKEALFSSKTDFNQTASSYIYRHNEGTYGLWYPKHSDYGYSTSSVSVIFVPEQDNTVVFDAILFRTEIYNPNEAIINNSDILKETINRIKFSNSYIPEISSEAIVSDYEVNTAKRFLRKWRMQVPLTQNSNRFADSYMLATFEYDNNNNKSLKITDITAYFRSSK